MAEGTTKGLPVHTQVVRMLRTLALRLSAIQRLPHALKAVFRRYPKRAHN
jgi:hypothetical protein